MWSLLSQIWGQRLVSCFYWFVSCNVHCGCSEKQPQWALHSSQAAICFEAFVQRNYCVVSVDPRVWITCESAQNHLSLALPLTDQSIMIRDCHDSLALTIELLSCWSCFCMKSPAGHYRWPSIRPVRFLIELLPQQSLAVPLMGDLPDLQNVTQEGPLQDLWTSSDFQMRVEVLMSQILFRLVALWH